MTGIEACPAPCDDVVVVDVFVVHGLLMRLKSPPSRMLVQMRGFRKQYWILWKIFIFVSAYVGFR